MKEGNDHQARVEERLVGQSYTKQRKAIEWGMKVVEHKALSNHNENSKKKKQCSNHSITKANQTISCH